MSVDFALSVKPADELAERWEVRALREARGKTAAVVLAVLAAEIPMALPILLRVAFPDFRDISLPALVGYATITEEGTVVSRMINKNRCTVLAKIYDSEDDMRGDLRSFADMLRMTDDERGEMFRMIKKWVTTDLRYDHENKKVVH